MRKILAYISILSLLGPNLSFVYANDYFEQNILELQNIEEIPNLEDNYFGKLNSFRYLFFDENFVYFQEKNNSESIYKIKNIWNDTINNNKDFFSDFSNYTEDNFNGGEKISFEEIKEDYEQSVFKKETTNPMFFSRSLNTEEKTIGLGEHVIDLELNIGLKEMPFNFYSCYYYENYCFFVDNDGIYRINQDGTNRIKILEAGGYILTIKDDYIIFGSSITKAIYKIKIDGTNLIKIIDQEVYNIQFFGDYIYYLRINDGYKLYRIKLDGTDRGLVGEKFLDFYNIFTLNNGFLYYTKPFDENLIYFQEKTTYSIYKKDVNDTDTGNEGIKILDNLEGIEIFIPFIFEDFLYLNIRPGTPKKINLNNINDGVKLENVIEGDKPLTFDRLIEKRIDRDIYFSNIGDSGNYKYNIDTGLLTEVIPKDNYILFFKGDYIYGYAINSSVVKRFRNDGSEINSGKTIIPEGYSLPYFSGNSEDIKYLYSTKDGKTYSFALDGSSISGEKEYISPKVKSERLLDELTFYIDGEIDNQNFDIYFGETKDNFIKLSETQEKLGEINFKTLFGKKINEFYYKIILKGDYTKGDKSQIIRSIKFKEPKTLTFGEYNLGLTIKDQPINNYQNSYQGQFILEEDGYIYYVGNTGDNFYVYKNKIGGKNMPEKIHENHIGKYARYVFYDKNYFYFNTTNSRGSKPEGLFAISRNNIKENPKTILSTNYYYLTKDENYFYYKDKSHFLYKMNIETGQSEKIFDEYYFNDLLFEKDGNIYFNGRNVENNQELFFRVNFQNNSIDKIMNSYIYKNYKYFEKDGYLYYQNQNDEKKLYKINLASFNESYGEKICDDVDYFTPKIIGNKLYYGVSYSYGEQGLYVLDLNTKNKIKLYNQTIQLEDYYIKDNKVYFSHGETGIKYIDLTNYNLQEGKLVKNLHGYLNILYVDNDYIYYSYYENYIRNFYRVNLNNYSDNELIFEAGGFSYNPIFLDKIGNNLIFKSNHFYNFDLSADFPYEPEYSHEFISPKIIGKKEEISRISVNIKANVPEKTNYQFFVAKDKNGPFHKIDKSQLDGEHEINLENLFGHKVDGIYYKFRLGRTEKNKNLTPVINQIEILNIDAPKIIPNSEFNEAIKIKVRGTTMKADEDKRCYRVAVLDVYNPLSNIPITTIEKKGPKKTCGSMGRPAPDYIVTNSCELGGQFEDGENYLIKANCIGGSYRTGIPDLPGGWSYTPWSTVLSVPKTFKSKYKDIDEEISVTPNDGEFIFQKKLLSVPSSGPDFNVEVTSRSLVGYNSILGKNFDHNYNKYLKENLDGSFIYHDGRLNDIKFDGISPGKNYNRKIKATILKGDSEKCEYKIDYAGKVGSLCFTLNNNSNYLEVSSIIDKFGKKITFEYDKEDKLNSVKDSEDRIYSYLYNNTGLLDTITTFGVIEGVKGYNKKILFSYNSNKLTKITKDNSNYSSEKFNTKANIVEVSGLELNNETSYITGKKDYPPVKISKGNVNPDKKSLEFYYDNNSGNIAQITDYRGNVVVNNVYNNLKISQFSHGYNTRDFEYIIDSEKKYVKQVKETKPGYNNNYINYTYDERGNLITQKYYEKSGDKLDVLYKQDNDYNQYNELIKTHYYKGNFEEFTYNERGNLTHYYKGKGHNKILYKNLVYTNDLVSRETYPKGKIDYSYNIDGSLRKKITTFSSPYKNMEEVLYNYDNGNLISHFITNGKKTHYKYDNFGNIISKKIGEESSDIIEKYEYDLFGNLVNYVDANGNKYTYRYDRFDNKINETTPEGKYVDYEYDANNNLVKFSQFKDWAIDKTTEYTYDLLNNRALENKFDLDKKVSYFNAKNNLNFEFNGKVAKISKYDFLGNLVETQEYASNWDSGAGCWVGFWCGGTAVEEEINKNINKSTNLITKYEYDKNNNLIKQIDYEGNETKFGYDEMDRLVRKIDADGSYQVYFYDNSDNVIRTRYYDKDGKLAQTQVAEYYLDGKKKYEGYKDEVYNKTFTTAYTFDVTGNLTREQAPGNIFTNYIYDNVTGRLESTEDNYGNEQFYKYDKAGNIIEINFKHKDNTLLNSTLNYFYNRDNQKIKESSKIGEITTEKDYKYNDLGNLIEENVLDGNCIRYIYDDYGRKTEDMQFEGNCSTIGGNVSSTSNVKYIYDGINLSKIIDGNSNPIYEFKYDDYGRIKDKIKGQNAREVYEYYKDGKIKNIDFQKDNKTNASVLYEYDKLGRINIKRYYEKEGNNNHQSETSVSKYNYDSVGRLESGSVEAKINNKQYKVENVFKYDYLGNLVLEKSKFDNEEFNEISYEYNNISNLTKLKTPLGRIIEYQYDDQNKLDKILETGKQIIKYEYLNKTNLVNNIIYGNSNSGVNSKFYYDNAGRIAKIINYSIPNNQTLDYSFDKTGFISSKNIINSDNRKEIINNINSSFKYDGAGRLLKVENNDFSENYTYDKSGNRTITTSNIYPNKQSNKYTSNNANQYKYANLGGGKHNYTYDERGNLFSDNKIKYFYDYKNTLIEVKNENKFVKGFLYDILGRRVKIIGENDKEIARYTYAGDKIIYEKKKYFSKTLENEFIYGQNGDDDVLVKFSKEILPFSLPVKIYYFQKDHLGSITRQVSDPQNKEEYDIEEYYYDAFGLPFIKNVMTKKRDELKYSDTSNDRLYTGREYDSELELYYYRARYYNPELGRFLSEDPQGVRDDVNLYSYVKNNPINYTDPSGEYLVTLGIILGSLALNYLGNKAIDWAEEYFHNEGDTETERRIKKYRWTFDVATLVGGLAGAGLKLMLKGGAKAGGIAVVKMPGIKGQAYTGGFISKKLKGGVGFDDFNDLKKYMHNVKGVPKKEGYAWHHLVEQYDGNLTKFGAKNIHNTKNIVYIRHRGAGSLHRKITGYYNSKIKIGNKKIKVRDYTFRKDFDGQYDFGIDTLNYLNK